jgi:hypothetical protein
MQTSVEDLPRCPACQRVCEVLRLNYPPLGVSPPFLYFLFLNVYKLESLELVCKRWGDIARSGNE